MSEDDKAANEAVFNCPNLFFKTRSPEENFRAGFLEGRKGHIKAEEAIEEVAAVLYQKECSPENGIFYFCPERIKEVYKEKAKKILGLTD